MEQMQLAKERRKFVVEGIVQGVGFRPFVSKLARQYGLCGVVWNDSIGVTIEGEGTPEALDAFQHALIAEKPRLAYIDFFEQQALPVTNDNAFVIAKSKTLSERRALISPDASTCPACVQEIFDPANRRLAYPFTNCTDCGPRFTIIRDVPYDRPMTTMGVFKMCPTCQQEYDAEEDRRNHAQPNACPVCGPRLFLLNNQGERIASADPLLDTARALAAGELLAIKGLGGYHLACDALNAETVQRLREHKHREAKPFALMVADLASARRLCTVSQDEADLLQSHRSPIVLLRKHADTPAVLEHVSSNDTLGIMLAYTPLHHVLLQRCAEVFPSVDEQGRTRPVALVMTSGNVSDEPIAFRDYAICDWLFQGGEEPAPAAILDDDPYRQLAPMVQKLLVHNRKIHMRCDDSVARILTSGPQLFRRSRGYTPEPIRLAFASAKPVLACGPQLKNTFCLVKGHRALVGHHIGDLDNVDTQDTYHDGLAHFQYLFGIQPEVIAYDLHPEYYPTQYALQTAIPHKIGVQHHHAHIASVLAEHGLAEQVIGVAVDGTGYGLDGAVWGCEVMVADLLGFERKAHLAYVSLPGGEAVAHEPWRIACVYLDQAFGSDFLALDIPFVQRLNRRDWATLHGMILTNFNSPLSSSMGRLFDAVAALLGLRDTVSYEGQAAIELEALATQAQTSHPYPYTVVEDAVMTLDTRPMIREIVADLRQQSPLASIAARFHATVAAMLLDLCLRVRTQTTLNRVALSGGVFQNRLLLEQLTQMLQEHGFEVYSNRSVPPNDGGVSLGQAAIAAAQISR